MKIDRRTALIGSLAAGLAGKAAAQMPSPTVSGGDRVRGWTEPTETILLWPKGVPGMPAKPPVEKVNERSTNPGFNDRSVQGIVSPRLAVFRPRQPNGASILLMPGGGYSWVVVDKEGYELGSWFAERGFTCFILFYRLPGDGWAAGPDTALQDAQRAMRLIRSRAADYDIDPSRVCAMGFSAGGHLCADLVARFDAKVYPPVDQADAYSARPFVAAPIYPVVSMTLPHAHAGSRKNLIGAAPTPELEAAHSPHLNIRPDSPPCFIVHAEDDATVPVENSLLLRAALKARQIAVEIHLFTEGGHGFGLTRAAGKPAAAWPTLFLAWAKARGVIS